MSEEMGLQYDQDKLARYDLIDPDFLRELAETLGMGAVKYAPDNWKKGLSFRRCFASKMRNAWAWYKGETHCPEDGQHHLIADTFRNMVLYKLEKMGRVDCDDRNIDDRLQELEKAEQRLQQEIKRLRMEKQIEIEDKELVR